MIRRLLSFWPLCLLYCFIVTTAMLVMCQSCAQTETQKFGYQTGDLIQQADDIVAKHPEAASAINGPRKAYNDAVLNGDAKAMREALKSLDRAEKLWGGE